MVRLEVCIRQGAEEVDILSVQAQVEFDSS